MGEKLTARMRACLELVASDPSGSLDIYDDRIEQFCDDNDSIRVDDTINRCFSAKLLTQIYDADADTGSINITPAGLAALSEKGRE